jgi:hypothetical protein
VGGPSLVGREDAQTVKTMDQRVFEHAVVVRVPAPAVVRLAPRATGTVVEEHVEGSGKVLVRTQAANFLGVLQNACHITQLLEPSATPQVPLSLRLLLQEIRSGKTELLVASASYSLLLLVGR